MLSNKVHPPLYFDGTISGMIITSKIRKVLTLLFIATSINTFAQDLSKGITYSMELNAVTSSGDTAPFWFTENRYGLSSISNNSGYIRGGVFRDARQDSLCKVRLGYGVDVAIPINYTSDIVIQQLYGELEFKKGGILIGSKELPLEFKNKELSTGDMTYGINARPIPQIRIGFTDYCNIPLTNGWFAFKGHIAYGWNTDGQWQEDFTKGTNSVHCRGVKMHSKAGYVRLGKEDVFPLTATAGVQFCAQFGGEMWNVGTRLDDDYNGSHVMMSNGLNSYWHAFFPGGRDVTDASYDNAEGNHVGSYQACINYKGKGWNLKGYVEHFFEDHSQMFFQYDWKDFLWGVEIDLPKNPFIKTMVYEYVGTKDQTGPIYHDHTHNLSTQISGTDNYYNHNIYGGWHHWGQAIGNPLIISPIYNGNKMISFYHNRVTAHHIGISGEPNSQIRYRVLYTHTESLGTYHNPLTDPKSSNYVLAELTYTPPFISGTSITGSFGANSGTLIGKSTGGMITIRKKGFLTR